MTVRQHTTTAGRRPAIDCPACGDPIFLDRTHRRQQCGTCGHLTDTPLLAERNR